MPAGFLPALTDKLLPADDAFALFAPHAIHDNLHAQRRGITTAETAFFAAQDIRLVS